MSSTVKLLVLVVAASEAVNGAKTTHADPTSSERPRRPNILFITADHLRYDTLGFTGDPVIKTSAIDALAARSVGFSQYFVQNPVCHPSRATIVTGRYPCNHGVRWNFSGLNENEVTLIEYFKKHGYTTACIGKYHLSQRRFERALDYKEASSIRNMRPDNPFIQYVKSRGYEYKTGFALPNFKGRLCAAPQPGQPEDCHLDAYVGMRTREYLRRVDKSKPFFLWLGFYGPHHPYVPSGRFATMYRADQVPPFHKSKDDLEKKPIEYRLFFHVKEHKFYPFYNASEQTFREMKAAYYGMVSQLDWQLGLVLKTLKELGLEENTIIVFTSDHGEFLGDHGIPGKGPFLLDCMLHVPCIIHAPGVGRQGVVCDELVESVDLFPTLCSLAGLKIPESVQGRDLTPLITGKRLSQYRSRTAIYAEAVDKRCIRTKEWKLIHYAGKDYGELYHLTEDPYELNNLYDERPDVREKMTLQYYRHLDSIEDFKHPAYRRYTGIDPKTGKEVTNYLTW